MRRSVIVANITAALLIASLIAPVSANVHAAGGVLLRYHWTVGQHFSSSTVSSQDTSLVFPKLPAANQTSKEIDRYTSVASVTKAFPDGSGIVHITYSNVSITKDGTTTKYPLKGYAIDVKVSSLGTVLSKTTIGKASADLPSDLTDPRPLEYPKAAIPVGGTWSKSQAIPPLGTMIEHIQLQSIGSVQGRQTATLAVKATVPINTSISGLAVTGTLNASGTEVIFTDTSADAAPNHLTMSLEASMKGLINGVNVAGTMTLSAVDEGTPVS